VVFGLFATFANHSSNKSEWKSLALRIVQVKHQDMGDDTFVWVLVDRAVRTIFARGVLGENGRGHNQVNPYMSYLIERRIWDYGIFHGDIEPDYLLSQVCWIPEGRGLDILVSIKEHAQKSRFYWELVGAEEGARKGGRSSLEPNGGHFLEMSTRGTKHGQNVKNNSNINTGENNRRNNNRQQW
jgi:hypothetical protein